MLIPFVGCLGAACAPVTPPPSTPEDVASNESNETKDEEPVTPELKARASKIRVLESNEGMGCPMEVIGLVDVHEPVKTVDQALRELRLDAARLDAEAVVGVEFHHGEPGEEPTHLSGEAVRCNDLLKGRNYDVIDEIKVATKMGTEEALYSELRQKAKSEGADLILNVQFVHGEGGDEPIRMSGTAIRFKD
ncbi:MAG: hypothetical protein ACRELY_02670, partial [Polyangiaceae bacterium]